jgi:hypothetical protein
VVNAVGHCLHLLADSGQRQGDGPGGIGSAERTADAFRYAVADQAGSAHVLDILRRETVSTLGMVGCPDIRTSTGTC